MRLSHMLTLLCGVLVTSPTVLNAKRLEEAKRWEPLPRGPGAEGEARRATDSTGAAPPRVKNITFSNPKASQFYVDGTNIPEVKFHVGPSWAGLVPISGAPNETRRLFFWFFPPGPQGSTDDLILWMNGGPGCSSLRGALQENGPISWQTGQGLPTQNEMSWTNLSSVLYIDQPVGTGYSQGTPDVKNEIDVSEQLVGFLQQFLEIFSELKGKNFYITGESYAGMYVPYLANFIYENTTRSTLDLNLRATWLNDVLIGPWKTQQQITAVNFVHKYEHVFAFNQTFLAQLDSVAGKCGYEDYMTKYVTYPPNGPLPLPGNSTELDSDCDVWDMIIEAALIINQNFNVYHITDTSTPWDVLGFPGSFPQVQISPVYFDRADVKAMLHVPKYVKWQECQLPPGDGVKVFPDDDASPPPAFAVLPNVIEKNNRTLIVHGLTDFVLIAEGTRIVLQNMTWNSKQGFQQPIEKDTFLVDDVGALGQMQNERGLTYVEISLAGHSVPGYSPAASFQLMEYLMGRRDHP